MEAFITFVFIVLIVLSIVLSAYYSYMGETSSAYTHKSDLDEKGPSLAKSETKLAELKKGPSLAELRIRLDELKKEFRLVVLNPVVYESSVVDSLPDFQHKLLVLDYEVDIAECAVRIAAARYWHKKDEEDCCSVAGIWVNIEELLGYKLDLAKLGAQLDELEKEFKIIDLELER